MRLTATLLGFAAFMCASAQGVWVSVADLPDDERWGPACFAIDGIGYMVGGYANGTDLDEVWAYDPIADSWTQKSSIPGVRRVATGFAIGNKGYVTCGLYDASSKRNDLWEYDPILDSWTSKSSLPSDARYGASGFSLNGLGYVAFGCIGSGTGPYKSDLWSYDPIFDSWTALASLPDQERVATTGFVADGRAFFFGGFQQDQTATNELWEYNVPSNNWSTRAALPADARDYSRGWTVFDVGIISGGNNSGTNYFDAWYYRPSTNTWMSLPDYAGDGSWTGASLSIGNRVFAGVGQTLGSEYADLWELTQLTIGLEEIPAPGSFTIAPNPCVLGGSFSISGIPQDHGGAMKVRFINILGAFVHEMNIPTAPGKVTAPKLASGTYVCELLEERGTVLARTELVLTD